MAIVRLPKGAVADLLFILVGLGMEVLFRLGTEYFAKLAKKRRQGK